MCTPKYLSLQVVEIMRNFYFLFMLIYVFTLLTTNITSERNEGYKYERKLVYNTRNVINSLRDLQQTVGKQEI